MARRNKPLDLPTPVSHPRYGDAPIRAAVRIPVQELVRSHWGHGGATIVDEGRIVRNTYNPVHNDNAFVFAESAIRADVTKQRHAVFPRSCYVDTLRRCRACGEWFLFFALEQRHWYEVLGFWVDADCVHCCACRRADQKLRRAQHRYAERIVHAETLGDREFRTLLKDALFLTECGAIKGDAKLRRLRNLAEERELSGHPMEAVRAFLRGARA